MDGYDPNHFDCDDFWPFCNCNQPHFGKSSWTLWGHMVKVCHPKDLIRRHHPHHQKQGDRISGQSWQSCLILELPWLEEHPRRLQCRLGWQARLTGTMLDVYGQYSSDCHMIHRVPNAAFWLMAKNASFWVKISFSTSIMVHAIIYRDDRGPSVWLSQQCESKAWLET